MQLRGDIGCAVIASGPVSALSSARDRGRSSVGKRRCYDPIDHVHALKQRPDLRLFVVSDRKDKLVSYRSQLEFVERVKAHNLPITHVIATATDEYSHGLFADGHRLAVDCANKARDQNLISKNAPAAQPLSKPTANASVGGFSLTPSIKLPSVGSFAPASAAKPKEAEPKPVKTETIKLPPNPAAIPAIPHRAALYEEDPAGRASVSSARRSGASRCGRQELARSSIQPYAPTSKFRSGASRCRYSSIASPLISRSRQRATASRSCSTCRRISRSAASETCPAS